METEFKKERNETYETFQLLAWKQHIAESLEQFHSVLSGLPARCNFGALETRILRDVFIVNMNNREAQNELCRSTKTPEEVYRIALSYERGYKYAKSYGSATGGATKNGNTGGAGAFQIKTEPVGDIVTVDNTAVDRSGDDQTREVEHLKGAKIVINPILLRSI